GRLVSLCTKKLKTERRSYEHATKSLPQTPQRHVARPRGQRQPGRGNMPSPRHHARTHGQRVSKRREIRWRGYFPVRPAREHRPQRRRPPTACRQASRERLRRRVGGRSHLAADRWWLSHGQPGGSPEI